MSSFEPQPRRRRIVAAVAAGVVLVVVVVAAAVVLLGRESTQVDGSVDPGASSSSASAPIQDPPSSSTSANSTSSPAVEEKPTEEPSDVGRTTTAPLEQKAESGKGVTVQVMKIEPVKGKAHGPGEIAGQAVRLTVQVDNGSDKRLSMELALVNAYYGKARTPAAALSGPGAHPLAGSIEPGGSASGRYVFGVPKRKQDKLTVEFSYKTDAPTVIFSG